MKITNPDIFLERFKGKIAPSSKEDGERAVRKARKNVHQAREHMMDRHNEIVAESQKKMAELIAKKRMEQDIRTAEETRDTLNEKALLERLKSRQIAAESQD